MIKIISLCSGSKGNSLYIEINNLKFLFDVGKTYTYLKDKLSLFNISIKDINYVFLSHTHSDHISSLPLIMKNTNAFFCTTKELAKEVERYPNTIIFEEKFEIEGITIKKINASHDVENIYNYIITYKDKKVVFITDTGYIHSKHFKTLSNADMYIIESNHDIEMLKNGPYPEPLKNRVISDYGHLSNNQTGFYLSKLITDKTKHVLLTHLSEKNNTVTKALNTVKTTLKEENKLCKSIKCALQNEVSEVYIID